MQSKDDEMTSMRREMAQLKASRTRDEDGSSISVVPTPTEVLPLPTVARSLAKPKIVVPEQLKVLRIDSYVIMANSLIDFK